MGMRVNLLTLYLVARNVASLRKIWRLNLSLSFFRSFVWPHRGALPVFSSPFRPLELWMNNVGRHKGIITKRCLVQRKVIVSSYVERAINRSGIISDDCIMMRRRRTHYNQWFISSDCISWEEKTKTKAGQQRVLPIDYIISLLIEYSPVELQVWINYTIFTIIIRLK